MQRVAKRSFSIQFGVLVISILLVPQLVYAVSISPTKEELLAQPGDVIEGTIKAGNTGDEPREVIIKTSNYYTHPEQGSKQYVQDDLPRGMYDWISLEVDSQIADPDEVKDFNYTINVPKDAAPGTYNAAFLATTKMIGEDVSVGVSGQAVSLLYLTIEGDYVEDLSLLSFGLDNAQFLKGNMVFQLEFENKGDVLVSPTGNIEIYDKSGKKLDEVYALTQVFDGEKVVTGRENAIPVNKTKSNILPGETKILSVPWENIKLDKGDYTAKATLYYGEAPTEIRDEFEFELIESFNIKNFTVESFFNSGLPVDFSASLQNIGNQKVQPVGNLLIKNIFGQVKSSQVLGLGEVDGGSEKTIDNMSWDNGFAFGYYTANLEISVGDKLFNATTGFWVLNPWIAIVVVLVIIVAVLIAVKFTKSYLSMKKRLKEKEKGK